MSRHSWEAVALAKTLWTYWDLGPGAVEVRWTDGWFKGGTYQQGWEITWEDGPTIAQICQAARAVPAGPAIGELVHGDLVRYERYLTLMAWAVSLVRHVRGGGQVPQPDDSQIEEAWRERLQRTEFPERARSVEEQALAGVLLRRGLRDYRHARTAVERAWYEARRTLPAPPMPEVLMGRALAIFSLEALEQATNVVELPRHGVDRADGGFGLP